MTRKKLPHHRRLLSIYADWKYTFLLIALSLVVLTRMAGPQGQLEIVLIDAFSALLVVAAIMTVCTERHYRVAALLLGGPVILFLHIIYLVPKELTRHTQLVGRVCAVVFLTFTVTMIVRAVVTARNVTWDTVVGAFSGYILIGVIWTQMYCAIDIVDPQAFVAFGAPLSAKEDVLERQAVLEYLSFATLSTVGYGDVTPASRFARSLSTLEAVCGQFYMAVLVAGLIGIRTPATRPHADPD